jgi:hypothetical protein
MSIKVHLRRLRHRRSYLIRQLKVKRSQKERRNNILLDLRELLLISKEPFLLHKLAPLTRIPTKIPPSQQVNTNCKSTGKLTTRVSPSTPPQIPQRHLLILSPIRQISRWIPSLGIAVDRWIQMNICHSIHNVRSIRNNFSFPNW